ncbi:MAG: sugar ABC transporter permease [Chloroflexota bacterium]|nr:sugar ABC transporter permease [Chloroflexota bacterium]
MTAAAPSRQHTTSKVSAVLASFSAFLLVVFVITAAVIISAPTKGVRISDFDKYLNEVFISSPGFVLFGFIVGVIVGLAFAVMVYRVWPDRRKRSDFIAGYLFLAPYLLITLVFTLGVLLFAIYISFTKYDIFTDPVFVGIDNYIKAFETKDFKQSLYNVFWYALIVTTVQTVLALLLAVFLNQKMRGKGLFRTVFYTPSVTSSVVISMIFWWLYLKTGWLNYSFASIWGLFGAEWQAIEWLNDPRGLIQLIAGVFGAEIPLSQWYLRGPSITWMAIMFQNIFTTIPTFMIMFLAALQDIPTSLYEAADIDGANGWRKLIHITVPMLRPIILLIVVLGTIGTLQIFDQVKILTSGSPLGTTLTPVFMVYSEALGTTGAIQMGYASSMAFILAIIIFIFAFVQRRYIERGTEQY